ncbi:MAG TPA: VWA domain-containing protein [Chloroflexi bacterium]|nr:VWA domain-containing protein [Chloroflexota bacterium]
MRYRYSRWSSSQSSAVLDASDVLNAMSDDVVEDGDVSAALQSLTKSGVTVEGELVLPGFDDLLSDIQAARQESLERYDLDSMIEDVGLQVADVISTERRAIAQAFERSSSSQADDQELSFVMENVAGHKQELLDGLPEDLGAAIAELSEYEFLDLEARARFEGLMDMLQRHVLQSHAQSMERSLLEAGEQGASDLARALEALNDLIDERLDGGDPDFERFRSDYGHHFPPAGSLEDMLVEIQEQSRQTESLLSNMGPDSRQALERTMQSVVRDAQLRESLSKLAERLPALLPPRPRGAEYPFSGAQSLSLEEALVLMRRMHDLDALETSVRECLETGDWQKLDLDSVRRSLGDAAGDAAEQLVRLPELLQDAGFIGRQGHQMCLTARGLRKLGQKALDEIFHRLKRNGLGEHRVEVRGPGTDLTTDTKTYEFGDRLALDIQKTLMNAVARGSVRLPLQLEAGDFEVFRSELATQAATVLMLDLSRSMPLRGCFVAAKKVTLALDTLIRTQFPRDRLHVVGFSDLAREVEPDALLSLSWRDYVQGTNLQHGFMVARRLLGRHRHGNRQIIVITDGEPTAHFSGRDLQFSYPPSAATYAETLREVQRCTRERITINTFMLGRSHVLTDFVTQMTRINSGRAFFASPEKLADFILLDYVAAKRRP